MAWASARASARIWASARAWACARSWARARFRARARTLARAWSEGFLTPSPGREVPGNALSNDQNLN